MPPSTDAPAPRRWWLPPLMGAVSGGLLFLSDYPVHAWWIQVIALAPWLWAVARHACGNQTSAPHHPRFAEQAQVGPRNRAGWMRPGWGVGALSGTALGLTYTGSLSLMLQFPWMLALGLAAYLTFFWALLGAGAAWILRAQERLPGKAVGAALAVACLATLVEWLNVSIIPVWGTAQVFTRVWSAFPPAIQLTSVTGVLGLVWAVTALGALTGAVLMPKAKRLGPVVALSVILSLVIAANAALWPRRPVGKLRVAAVGWIQNYKNLSEAERTDWHRTWTGTCLPLLTEAARRGARLAVTPETGVTVPAKDADAFLGEVKAAARRLGIFLAVGWFDRGRNDNRILFVDPQGTVMGEYAKTHLIMTLERYRPGKGARVVTTLDGFRLGGMICQDDNFTDLSRGYGRSAVHLVAVPTNDWAQVADYHFESSVFRAVDSRYAVVRAATNGHSAIISARGEVLAKVNHFQAGPALVVADVPLYPPGSLHAHAGHWIVIPSALWLLAVGLLGIRRRRSP